MSIVGVTLCPRCDSDLEPVGSDDGRPIQSVSQSCSSCSYDTTLGLCWYPNGTHDIVATLDEVDDVDKKPCTKSGKESAVVVVPADSPVPRYYATDHVRAHHEATIETVQS